MRVAAFESEALRGEEGREGRRSARRRKEVELDEEGDGSSPVRAVPLVDHIQLLVPVPCVGTESFRKTLRASSNTSVVVPALA